MRTAHGQHLAVRVRAGLPLQQPSRAARARAARQARRAPVCSRSQVCANAARPEKGACAPSAQRRRATAAAHDTGRLPWRRRARRRWRAGRRGRSCLSTTMGTTRVSCAPHQQRLLLHACVRAYALVHAASHAAPCHARAASSHLTTDEEACVSQGGGGGAERAATHSCWLPTQRGAGRVTGEATRLADEARPEARREVAHARSMLVGTPHVARALVRTRLPTQARRQAPRRACS
jgi:hypothetical protein